MSRAAEDEWHPIATDNAVVEGGLPLQRLLKVPTHEGKEEKTEQTEGSEVVCFFGSSALLPLNRSNSSYRRWCAQLDLP